MVAYFNLSTLMCGAYLRLLEGIHNGRSESSLVYIFYSMINLNDKKSYHEVAAWWMWGVSRSAEYMYTYTIETQNVRTPKQN